MKYHPLAVFLRNQTLGALSLSFAEAEGILGSSLPPSARRRRAWWTNNPTGHVNAQAWISAGYRIESVDLSNEMVTFRRMNLGEKLRRHPAFGGLAGTVQVMPGVDLTEPADPDWGQV